jgi:N-methylhydantoinase A
VYWGPHHSGSTMVRDRTTLKPDDVVHGPAVIEEATTSTLVPPGFCATVDATRNLIVRKESV